jgi:hypothetical protein
MPSKPATPGPARRPDRIAPDHKRALTLLVNSPNGMSEALMQARGVPPAMIEAMTTAGQVTIATMHRSAGRKVVPVRRITITAAGRAVIGASRIEG